MGFLVQKWPFRDAHLLSKKRPWNPYFYSVFWVRAFWAKVWKKGKFWKATQKRKNLTDNWKAIFWCFCFFLGGFLFFLFFVFLFGFVLFLFFLFFLVLFVGGFKGQVRWPKGPHHLALNPPYFFFCFCFFVLCFFLFFFGGFKGQVRWPKGPPHLALNPPYLFLLFLLFCFFWGFVFWLFNTEKKPCFPPEKGIFCLFSVFLFLSPLALLGLPLFLFLFLCLSFFFFSFFLPSCLCFCFILVPCFCLFLSFFLSLSSLLFFHERNNIQILNCKFFLLKSFLFFCFLPFLFQVPFS